MRIVQIQQSLSVVLIIPVKLALHVLGMTVVLVFPNQEHIVPIPVQGIKTQVIAGLRLIVAVVKIAMNVPILRNLFVEMIMLAMKKVVLGMIVVQGRVKQMPVMIVVSLNLTVRRNTNG